MYDKGTTNINWKDLIIKIILLALFLLLLWWIIPSPDLNTFYDKVFNQNLQTMKDAAKSYYTVDRLPSEIGDSEKMTLSEMLSQKMVIPFVDKNNKECSAENSYVQVTKNGEQEYELKVFLDCETQTDYILETIGCYDVCVGNDCPTTPGEEKITEYQFQKSTTYKKTYYTCPSGWTLSGTKCYKGTTTTDKKKASKVYADANTVYSDPRVVSEGTKTQIARVETSVGVTYTCPTNCKPTGDGSKCNLTSTKTTNLQPAGSEKDTCTWQDNGIVQYRGAPPANDANTKYEYIKTETIGGIVYNIYRQYCLRCTYKAYYMCNGVKQYTPSCTTTTTVVKACTKNPASTKYSCPVGDNIISEGSGSSLKCYKITKKVTYSCTDKEAKYDESLKKCVKTTEKKFKGYKCQDGWKLDGEYCYKYTDGKSVQNATAKTKNETSTAYKWSTSETLEGWTATGKTRTLVKVPVTTNKYEYNN